MNLGFASHIRRDSDCTVALGLNETNGFFNLMSAAGRYGYAHALPGESDGKSSAETTASASDERHTGMHWMHLPLICFEVIRVKNVANDSVHYYLFESAMREQQQSPSSR